MPGRNFGRGSGLGRAVVVAGALAAAGCARADAVQRAQSLAHGHREADAAQVLRDHLKDHPNDVDARRLLVRLLGYLGDGPAARAEVAALRSQLPKGDPTPWIELGHALELAHEFDAALAAYDDAAREAPLRFEGPREGGLRAARWGLAEQASERLTEARRRGAIDTETLHALGLARLATGDADGARKAYDECTLRKPSAAECHLGLATVALRANDFRSALAAYDGVVAHAPNYAAAHLGRAWCLGQLGRTKEADLALRAAERMGASKEHVAKQRAFLGSQIGAGGGEAR